MKLLYVIHNPVFGGGCNQIVQLREPLERRGWETLAIVQQQEPGNAFQRLREGGVDVTAIPLHRLRATTHLATHWKFAASFWSEIGVLRRFIRDHAVDVTQAHGPTNPHAAIAAHLEDRAVTWQLYDTVAPMALRRATMPLVTRIADAVTTWGDELAAVHPGALGLGHRQVTVFPPVDGDTFRPDDERRAAARATLGVQDGELLVGAVGVRNPSKGHQWLVRATARLWEAHPELVVRVLGAQSPVHAAHERMVSSEARATARSERQRVEFRDPGDQVPALMPAFDVFALTSIPHSEGIPTVILEAMACGIPVVATNVAAVRELVQDGVTGLIVPAEDDAAIATAIGRLLGDSELRLRLGMEARRVAVERFGLERLADRHVHAYEVALQHRSQRRRRRSSAGPRAQGASTATSAGIPSD